MAETYQIDKNGGICLLSPSRESRHNVLPETGGVGKVFTSFEKRILTAEEIKQLEELASTLRARLPSAQGIASPGPYDVELGFKDGRIWLFQVRPYVENKRAKSSTYLNNLDPLHMENRKISLTEKILRAVH